MAGFRFVECMCSVGGKGCFVLKIRSEIFSRAQLQYMSIVGYDRVILMVMGDDSGNADVVAVVLADGCLQASSPMRSLTLKCSQEAAGRELRRRRRERL